MHELSIATELYVGLRAEIEARGGGRLSAVGILVGELSAIEPDLLRFAWEAVVAGGPDDGATIEIKWCPVTQHCSDCGVVEESVPGSWLRPCPHCGAALLLEGGRELDVDWFGYDPPELQPEIHAAVHATANS